jgi:hypothetical protein
MSRASLAFALPFLAAGVASGPANAQDGIEAMCLLRDAAETCTCAARAFREAVTPEDYALYSDIGLDYTDRMAAGGDWVESWDETIAATAPGLGLSRSALMQKTNGFGRTVRDAIEACKA